MRTPSYPGAVELGRDPGHPRRLPSAPGAGAGIHPSRHRRPLDHGPPLPSSPRWLGSIPRSGQRGGAAQGALEMELANAPVETIAGRVCQAHAFSWKRSHEQLLQCVSPSVRPGRPRVMSRAHGRPLSRRGVPPRAAPVERCPISFWVRRGGHDHRLPPRGERRPGAGGPSSGPHQHPRSPS
jgi:hypothetical protein